MSAKLPTIQDLEKLPPNAIVEYAARTARRVSQRLQGIIPNDILENALGAIEALPTPDFAGSHDFDGIIDLAKLVLDAYLAAPTELQSVRGSLAVVAILQAAMAAVRAIRAANNDNDAQAETKRAASAAHRAAAAIDALEGPEKDRALAAARTDYEALLACANVQADDERPSH